MDARRSSWILGIPNLGRRWILSIRQVVRLLILGIHPTLGRRWSWKPRVAIAITR